MIDDRRHDEIASLLGAYALDAVDGDERAAVERHLDGCARCRAEVEQHREVAGMLGDVDEPAPAGVWDRISASLEPGAPPARLVVAPEPGTGPPVDLDAHRRRRRPSVPMVVAGAAAAAVIGVLGVATASLERRLDEAEDQLALSGLERAAADALAAPEAEPVVLAAGEGAGSGIDGRVVAVLLPDGQGYLLAGPLPAADDDRTYQLWNVGPERTVSLAVMGADPEVVPFRAEGDVGALVVTVEREGGVPVAEGPVVAQAEVT